MRSLQSVCFISSISQGVNFFLRYLIWPEYLGHCDLEYLLPEKYSDEFITAYASDDWIEELLWCVRSTVNWSYSESHQRSHITELHFMLDSNF